eukprot:CAMPEP_0172768846 /NCGR_PEP_ID=MMETSP1074-20121228/185503_1 /TAXON_ID=2916 /ORGANISM="Ceratium fusus, Strain PA161109" /LENGTH=86 /DNA_ID=CAMNT_0013604311 /DNA_START=304 /DNA_END=564 /DNA_ORIENTATION=-
MEHSTQPAVAATYVQQSTGFAVWRQHLAEVWPNSLASLQPLVLLLVAPSTVGGIPVSSSPEPIVLDTMVKQRRSLRGVAQMSREQA